MPNFEQAPDISAKDQEKKDLVQIIAEHKYAKANEEDGNGEEKLGPPNPENYKEAEEALNQLFDDVQADRYTVENFSRKAAVILGAAPATLGAIIIALTEIATHPSWKKELNEKRPTFLEVLRKELGKVILSGSYFATPEYSAAGRLKELKKDAGKLKEARDNNDSEVSE